MIMTVDFEYEKNAKLDLNRRSFPKVYSKDD